MDNIVLTLLDKEDALANENKLKCFKKYGITAGYTDVFSLTGGKTTLEKMTRIPDEFGLKNRTAPYAFNTVLKDESVFAIDETGNKTSVKENDTTFGIRPTIITFDSLFHTLIKNPYIGYNGVEEIEFGEYPQYASAHKVNIALEDEYSNNLENGKYKGGILIPTGKTYTFIQNNQKVEYPEYYYGTNKYIRMIASCDENGILLSNANKVYNNDPIWVKVTPVKWFIDYKEERLISKFVLLSGLKPDIRIFDFFSSYMKKDMFNNPLTKDNMLRMICERFYNLDVIKQVEWLKSIPCDCNDFTKLSEEELKKILDSISNIEFGYSRKLDMYHF